MSEREILKNSVRLNKITHSVRAAQIVLQYGVGAMVDFPDQTLMTAAPEYWRDPNEHDDSVTHIHDERLEKLLKVDYFGMPKDKDEYKSGIAYVRFPKWYFCPKCRRFQPLRKWVINYMEKAKEQEKTNNPNMKRPLCTECRVELVPTRIVVACKNGHIDDFPWVLWTHEKSFGGRRDICGNPEILFSTGATASAGLEGLVVKCRCGAMTTLVGAFDKDSLKHFYSCSGLMPWKNKRENCNAIPQVVQRGASKLYFPKTVSSLVIPPYSDKVNSLIANSQKYNACLLIIGDYDGDEKNLFIKDKLDKWSAEIANEININICLVKSVLKRKFIFGETNNMEDVTTNIEYRIDEYEALTGKLPQYGLDEYDFIRESKDISEYSVPGLTQVVLVHKIREVRALTGFSRLTPPDSFNLDGDNINSIMPIKEPSTRWYPGYEVRGEGIFLEFDGQQIEEWIINSPIATERANKLSNNYNLSYLSEHITRNITSKFILLHTIAHLLIRQMSFECGYTTASLRERIYCDSGNEDVKMSGIFIYTASGDSEGTLGGLVRQGYPDCFSQIVKRAFAAAEFCSNDSVCIESEGQGREALNLAACHSCLLLPETSCEEFNVFLDRALVVGTLKNRHYGYYSKWLTSGYNDLLTRM